MLVLCYLLEFLLHIGNRLPVRTVELLVNVKNPNLPPSVIYKSECLFYCHDLTLSSHGFLDGPPGRLFFLYARAAARGTSEVWPILIAFKRFVSMAAHTACRLTPSSF